MLCGRGLRVVKGAAGVLPAGPALSVSHSGSGKSRRPRSASIADATEALSTTARTAAVRGRIFFNLYTDTHVRNPKKKTWKISVSSGPVGLRNMKGRSLTEYQVLLCTD